MSRKRPKLVVTNGKVTLGAPAHAVAEPDGDSTAHDPDRALTTLRGASVAVDPRRAAQVAVTLGMATLLILAVVFFVVGIHKNGQITSLERHGAAVSDTVTGCVGLLGGSGSNSAGYRCWGVFTIDGHRYTKDIPGTVLRPIGSKVPVLADTADPGLITTASELNGEHASDGVFIVPALLLVAFLILAGLLAVRLRAAGRLHGQRAATARSA
jgi:hypothetical protein